LQRRRLPRIVGANKDYGLAEFDLDIFKALEVLDSEASEHFRRYYRADPCECSIAVLAERRTAVPGSGLPIGITEVTTA
jgi:hypothetical protein